MENKYYIDNNENDLQQLMDKFIQCFNIIGTFVLNKSDEQIESIIYKDYNTIVYDCLAKDNLQILLSKGFINNEIMYMAREIRDLSIEMLSNNKEQSIDIVKTSSKWNRIFVLADQTREFLKIQKPKDDNEILSILTGIIYPIILAIICLYAFSSERVGIARLVIGLLFCTATSVSIIIGGFYLIIIPLPYIFFYKWGCSKSKTNDSKKLLYGILSIIFPILALIIIFG